MKNLTIATAIKIGFDFENAEFDSKEELQEQIMDFLFDNEDKLPKKRDYCEVSSNGREQCVNHCDFSGSGEFINYQPYWGKKKQKIYHSSYLFIDKNGKCYNMLLWCWSK